MRGILASPWLRRGIRLSLLVGFVGAAWHARTVWDRYRDDVDRSIKSEVTYRCAAGLSDDQLRPHMNEFGNINVKTLCITVDDFFVSLDELEQVRDGTLKFEPYWQPFDWPGTVIVGLLWSLATILATIAVLGVAGMARWVWGQ